MQKAATATAVIIPSSSKLLIGTETAIKSEEVSSLPKVKSLMTVEEEVTVVIVPKININRVIEVSKVIWLVENFCISVILYKLQKDTSVVHETLL